MRDFSLLRARWAPLALLLAAALGIGGIVLATGSPSVDSRPAAQIVTVEGLGNAFAQVTEVVSPAVVYIQVEKNSPMATPAGMPNLPEWFDQNGMREFFGGRPPQFKMPQRPESTTGQGSGFIISKDGYILTNNHVVGGADRVKVVLGDGRSLDAEIVGSDARSDVAVVKVDAEDLPVLPLGNSDEVRAGEWVLAVGSPFGLSGTVTSGIVSATGRNNMGITDYENFIQTDAAINPGNSGGPLVNLSGEAIAINTAIFSRNGGYQGIGFAIPTLVRSGPGAGLGFAIPINLAHDVCDQLIASGAVTRGYLGILIQPMSEDLAKSFGLDSSDGVLIGDVTADSPAAKAGLQSGDVIVQFNGKAVAEVGSFRNQVAATQPGQEIEVVAERDGHRQTMAVTIGELEDSSQTSAKAEAGPLPQLGLSVQTLTGELAQQLGYGDDNGIVITEVQPGSQAADAGLKPGMLIKQVNRQPVESANDFRRLLNEQSDATSVLLLVRQGEHTRFVVLPLAN